MPSDLDLFPPEILHTVLSYLPIQSLIAFARTNRANYQSTTYALNTLELAVFPKQVYATLAFLDAECPDDIDQADDTEVAGDPFMIRSDRAQPCLPVWKRARQRKELHEVGIISQPLYSTIARVSPGMHSRAASRTTSTRPTSRAGPRLVSRPWSASSHSPLELRTREITIQNDIAEEVLSSPTLCYLKSLTLHLYDLFTPSLASTLASALPSLQHLCLNFSHPYIHDTTLPPRYWRETPSVGCGSPVWNSLAGIGDEPLSSLRLRNLRALTLKRSSITSFQLRSWIQRNPSLRHLHFEKVRGVDQKFCQWLGDYVMQQRIEGGGGLERIALVDCGELACQTEADFGWIGQIAGTHLSDGSMAFELGFNCGTEKSRHGEHDQGGRKKPCPIIGPELQYLSLRSCAKVNEELFLRLACGDVNNDNDEYDISSKMSAPFVQSSSSTAGNHELKGWRASMGVLVSPQNVRLQRTQSGTVDESSPYSLSFKHTPATTFTPFRRRTMDVPRSGSQSPPLNGLPSKGPRAEQADNINDIQIEVDPDAM